MPLKLVESKQVRVHEVDEDVDAHLVVRQGDTLVFQASGQIWAGVWLTGNNGPKGWNNIDHDPKYPLPGTHPYALLGKLDTGYFYVGDNARIDRTSGSGKLFLRINDNEPGNGSGMFECLVQVYREQ